MLTSYCADGIVERYKKKIVAFVKGKDSKEFFEKYAYKDGFFKVKETTCFLIEAGSK